MCHTCNKDFCVCLGEKSTQAIIESYVPKLSTIMFVKGTLMTETEFKRVQKLQSDMVLWLSETPVPHIHNVIKSSMMLILRNTHILRCDQGKQS